MAKRMDDSPSSSYPLASSLLDHTTFSPTGPHWPTSPLPALNPVFSSLLRRHHTLNTGAGSRLARLEYQQALSMAKRDRQFYGSSGDGSSLSGYESEDSDPSYRSILPPGSAERCTPVLASVLDYPQPMVSTPHSSLFNPIHLLGACKGSGKLLSHDVTGSPVDDLIAGSPTPILAINDAEGMVKDTFIRPPRRQSSQLAFSDRLDAIGDRHQSGLGILLPSSPVGLHNPVKRPNTALTHLVPTQFHPSQRSWTQLPGCVGSKPPSMTSHPPLRHRHSNLNDYTHSTTETLEEEEEGEESEDYVTQPINSVQSSPSERGHRIESSAADSLPPPSVTLHRATSDRVSSTHHPFQTHSNPRSMSRWSDHATLRRHQSMKTEGRWATGMVTNSNSAGNQFEESLRSPDPNSVVTVDTHYKASPPLAPISSDALRSTPNLSVSSSNTPAFSQKLLSNSPPSLNPVAYSSHSGSVTPIGSPVSVPAFSLNPWSPTVEEAKKLRDPMLRQTSVDNLGAGRSISPRPSKSATIDSTRFRSASGDEIKSGDINMLHSNFNRLGLSTSDELNSRSNLTSSASHRPIAAKSPLSISTSMTDVMSGITSPQELTNKSGTLSKKMILPPLVTTFPRQTSTPSAGPIGSTPASVDSGKRNSGASMPFQGPASAAAYVPPIGHSLQHNPNDPFNLQEKMSRMGGHNTAAPGVGASTWLSQKERLVGKPSFNLTKEWNSPILSTAASNTLQSAAPLSALPHQIQQQMLLNQQLQQLQQLQAQQQLLQQQQVQLLSRGMGLSTGLPPLATNLFPQNWTPATASSFNMHPIGPALQNNGYSPSMRFPANFSPQSISPVATSGPMNFGTIGGPNNLSPASNPSRLQTTIMRDPLAAATVGMNRVVSNGGPGSNMAPSVDIQQLANRKGYNPPNFDCKPKAARFFVIKSYTEEDVHKSLKYEIWASTDLGNKRLDKAFNESVDSGPIYLLFSVNASGHFCGMAEMLTAVDYNTSSKVWAQDKWKGIFKVRWVFVKDIPNNALRHIKLSNTPENKPVTSSRDTQEVPYDRGIEILQIMSSYQSRTTLLQDYAWYEHNESLKARLEPTTAEEKPAQQQLQQSNKPSAENRHQTHHQTNHRQSYQKQHGTAPHSQSIRRFSAVSKVPSAPLSLYHSQAPIEITSVI